MSIHSLKRGHKKLVAQLKGQGLRYSYIKSNGQLTPDPCHAAHFGSLAALERSIARYDLNLHHVHVRVLSYKIEDFVTDKDINVIPYYRSKDMKPHA